MTELKRRKSALTVGGTVASIFQRPAAKNYDETCEENILLLRLIREPGKMPATIVNLSFVIDSDSRQRTDKWRMENRNRENEGVF
jgi:hypothetical protein